ncbi:glucose 1-dehydrogenase [Fusarium mundagurra]|uniref:Glucose 1-dehydrogenase n=1 Tax=Fusarium mundagurra TaxID=1567541 RepID=A0A8H5Y3C4_9HYPO|nr:glucose 1-dehydrogenase [Fusarium mundagurra]
MSFQDSSSTFLGLESCHAFVTGAAGGVGGAAVKEFLANGCRVTSFDRNSLNVEVLSISEEQKTRLHHISGDLRTESSIAQAFEEARNKFGPVQILIANASITDESSHPSIWEIDTEKWDAVYSVNVRGTFLTIKHFLRSVKQAQEALGKELDNVAIVITGSETGVFGQAGHAEYASGKAALQYGLVKTVKNEIVKLNSKARINAVAPGWINTPLIGDRLDDPKERWAEAEATVALRKIAEPSDAARCMAFLASHRAAGHITGQCISVDGGQEGRLLWRETQDELETKAANDSLTHRVALSTAASPPHKRRRLRICLSVDFDAVSGLIGTGHVPENKLADYSAAHFGGNVGVDRLLRTFSKHGISQRVSWFIPGHSMESYPRQTQAIVASGAEIGLHGYSHEGAYSLSEQQERDILLKCIELATSLCQGKKPVGYRAPLYEIRESTVRLLEEHGFLYDASLNSHDSLPYFLPKTFAEGQPAIPDYDQPASTWMKPIALTEQPEPGSQEAERSVVEIPGSWYTEDATPLCYYPHSATTQGYVSTDVIEKMWLDRFEWLWENESFLDEGPGAGYGSIFPLILHPECAGRSHVIGMIDKFVAKLKAKAGSAAEGEITFECMTDVAKAWKARTPSS